MAQKNLRFGGLKNARNFSKFQQSKDIMKTGKSTSAIRFRVLPPFFFVYEEKWLADLSVVALAKTEAQRAKADRIDRESVLRSLGESGLNPHEFVSA
jgi:hypothetical protein